MAVRGADWSLKGSSCGIFPGGKREYETPDLRHILPDMPVFTVIGYSEERSELCYSTYNTKETDNICALCYQLQMVI